MLPYKFAVPTEHIIAMLIAERDKLNRAIEALQGSAKRRGRPPKAVAGTTAPIASAPKRKRRSAAQRKAQADRMKAILGSEAEKDEVDEQLPFDRRENCGLPCSQLPL